MSTAVRKAIVHSGDIRNFGPVSARTLGWATIVLAYFIAVAPAFAQQNVGVWLTSGDRTRLLTRQGDVPFVPDTPAAVAVTIDVDGAQTFQRFDGVGASMTESSASLMATALSDGDRATLMTQLFDPIAGVGLSILRQPVGASDFALTHYSFDDMPAGQTDVPLLHFSTAHDRTYILPALRAARQSNPNLLVMASPWSAPGWMKTLGSMIRGELKPEYYAPYAAYLVKFLQAYAADGVPIDRMTVQNEPHFTGEDYPGMYMTSADQATFIRDYLAPAMARANLTTTILAFDQNWSEPNYPLEVFADPAARAAIGGSAFHCYAGDPTGMSGVHTAYPDKSLHVTECSGFTEKTFAESLMWTTRVLLIGSMRNWAESVLTWNLALDEQSGPHLGGCVDCVGLATINRSSGAVTFNAAYYALGHVSKFVQRGATRVASTTYPSSGVEDVTFRNPDGSYVLIVSNDWSDRTIKVRMGSASFSYALAASTVATFTWPGVAAPLPVPPSPARLTVPGLIEAENFDQGGEGRAYHDLTPGNIGGAYRNEGVDIEATTDAGGGYNVGWISAGEWLEYSVDVTQAGAYAMDARVASSGPGGTFHVEVNGVDKTGPIVIPNTHGWQSWVTVTRTTAPLAAGAQRLRIVVDANGANGDVGNINYIRLSAPVAPPPATSTPYSGTAAAVPGVIEAENFDNGGEGLAYHDLGPGNSGGLYRVSDVDIEASADTGGGYDVGWMQAGEWLKYTVTVGVAGAYRLDLRVAANGAGGTFHVEANQKDVTGPLTIPNTGGWQAWRTLSKTGVALSAGIQVLRVVIDAAGATGVVGNLNYLQVTSAAVSTPPPAAAANLALGRAASSSSNENTSYVASLAVDGSTSSRWSSAFSDPQWLAVDLGASASISRVVLRWETAYGADYDIQTSSDNVSWTTVRSVTAGDGGIDDLTGLTASGRYVRVYGKRRGTPWGYSLWELEVWARCRSRPHNRALRRLPNCANGVPHWRAALPFRGSESHASFRHRHAGCRHRRRHRPGHDRRGA